MTISQTTSEETTAGHLSCPLCNATLPLRATFCGSCGERLKRKKQSTPLDEQDIHTRYRVTTLVRRHPLNNLYFALDSNQLQKTGQARMVAIRDINISGLEKEARDQAIVLVQQEYDCLRRWHIPHTLACIDLRVFQGHLFLVSGLPVTAQETATAGNAQRLYTLQDFLQSGLGLPREARTLEWAYSLCQAVEQLHRHHVILGDLDPYTVVLNKNSAQAEPKLMVFWLWPELQKLLSQPLNSSSPQVSYFKAPETLAGKAEVRSDVYSLGALLYLLLTGMPPDESTLRHRRRLRTPREISARISPHVDDCVMQALAIEPEERFPSVAAFMTALRDRHTRQPSRRSLSPAAQTQDVPISDVETVRIVPLSQKDVERWRTAREEKSSLGERTTQASQNIPMKALPPTSILPPAGPGSASYDKQAQEGDLGILPTTPPPGNETPLSRRKRKASERNTPPPAPPLTPRSAWQQRITNVLPAIKPEPKKSDARRKGVTGRTSQAARHARSEGDLSLLKQIQRLLLGQQQRAIEAAAIIETPMRIRPDQPYNLRLHVMGRDEPTPHPDARKGAAPTGLSALVHGETVQIEVRSVLQQGYTYILQQATVTIPASGYAAEVTIPMQQQTTAATGRRDRLHVFFLDDQRHPLYEKPFVVELFVSPLVQFGREGHQVLTIPI